MQNKEYVHLLNTISNMVNVYLFFQVRKEARSRHNVPIIWLCCWRCKEGFGFYVNGLCFNDCSLIERDGIIQSKKGKRILGSRLISLVRLALKLRTQMMRSKVAMLVLFLPPGQ